MKKMLYLVAVVLVVFAFGGESFGQEPAAQLFEDDCGCQESCCRCGPTWYAFGEFLYLRPRNAEVPYAMPINGPIVPPPEPNPIPIGPTAIVDPDYNPGFRVGFGRVFDECSNLGVAYTHFESQTYHQASINAPNVMRSLVSHPATLSASTDFLDANANYGIDFDLVDIDYRRIITCGPRHSLNYLIGVRYAGLQQDFNANFASLGTEAVTTDISFDGGGIRFGLEGERHAWDTGFLVYARGVASFVAGEFRTSYLQTESFDPTVVDTAWKGGRIVTMLDVELGVGWTSSSGCLRCNIGYVINPWFNVVKTDDYIKSVQTNNFCNLGDAMTFDGLVARVELRY